MSTEEEVTRRRNGDAVLGSGPTWFVIQSGEYEGRLHLSGWMHSAVAAAPGGTHRHGPAKGRPIKFHGFATCPVCFAMVSNEALGGGYIDCGYEVFAHEWWHHTSGTFPCPPELIAKAKEKRQ